MRLSLHSLHSKFESDVVPMEDEAEVDDSEEEAQVVEVEAHAEHHLHHEIRPIVGRSRQVVGLLVLQFGIMIHSFVIGLTLSVTSGSDFTSLTTAIIFHQLFEGLSLGIRIAALPPAHEHRHKPHLADHSGRWHRHNGVGFLTPTLSVLFALTTPVGLALGMLMWKDYRHTSNIADEASMLFTQGIMSSISAGMLIYSATVEMIAGDFVFGDVDGHNHHHQQQQDDNEDDVAAHDNGQTHGHGHELTGSISISGLQSINGGEANQTRASVWKKALAVLSLFAGSGMMVLIALAE
ncbi:hypothetical protein GALMADRAFT_227608 [Galerina marginata CBS 339.88]|uniref:Zinc/iron permease n=1 Tax=Galerina marginata (strain CBS 339.88) TaxID=685588 RepID=A0A067SUU3_GALM3|nr:hypothetical protein GALMADRAFT_227608 [Galerina marginata CBS 339.88]